MRKILIALFFAVFCLEGTAQINNDWINYNYTYYKFRVGKNGLHRIPKSALTAVGLGNVAAEYFQLWRNGEEVRIFTSVQSGPLGDNDYIEFWGKKNDGLPDKSLYRKPGFQLCDSFSIHSDTTSYFLCVNQKIGNLRYTSSINDVASNSLPAEPYFMRRMSRPYRDNYNRGYAVFLGEYIYSSSYDMGEGWTSYDVASGFDLAHEFTNMQVYTAGPANSLSLYISAFGNALNTRNLRVKMFNNQVASTPMNFFDTVKRTYANLPLTLLQSQDYLQVTMGTTSLNPNDRIVVAEVAITFPAKFNFNNQSNFYFDLPANANGNYVVIDNFNTGNLQPILYSLSDNKRYLGDISEAGKVKFALPPSMTANRKFILTSQQASNVNAVNSLEIRNFVDYSLPANQGDYLIISNPVLYNDGNGNNYVDQYKQYRGSAQGGAYKPIIIDINELTDQFAFGIKKHPLAIRDFIRFAYQQFNPRPQFVFMIGRGTTSLEYRQNDNNPVADKLNLVPTYGWPASDNLLACEQDRNVPLIPIGRVSCVNTEELKNYFEKVKEYEQVQQNPSNQISDREWMKRVIHIIGGADSLENVQFRGYMDNYKRIIEDTMMGARVETFEKTSSSAVELANGDRIRQLINEGVGEIGYFGHSSANTLAFNLTSPELFSNAGKYPIFNVSGCSAGNFFTYDPLRFTGSLSISEKYVLTPNRGSIAFIATTHLGVPPFLNFYNTQLYNAISKTMYGDAIGRHIQRVLNNLGSNPQALDFYTRIHLEQLNLHGDPAIKINAFAKPDYAIEAPSLKITPAIVSVADASFKLQLRTNNLGKAVSDSIRIYIERRLPNDSVQVLYNRKISGIRYADSLEMDIPINPLADKGLNVINVMIDADNVVDELSESNNSLRRELFIFEDEVRPISPYNFSIVNTTNVVYTASTSNPLSESRLFNLEIDTTEMFNSPFKKTFNTTASGGIIQFTPGNIGYRDSTVYYWRTAMVPQSGSTLIWNNSSFIYLAGSSTGFNQSHFYQHKKSSFQDGIRLDDDGVFRFKTTNRDLQIKTGLWPYTNYDRISVTLDFDQYEQYGCKYHSLQILVYDTINFRPWKNRNVGGQGLFGSWPICGADANGNRNMFEFPYNIQSYRKKAMDFIDSIPDGYYFSITNLGWTANNSFINEWKSDTAVFGSGKSLYHKLKSVGFTTIDSFTRNLPFIFFASKNNTRVPVQQIMGTNEADQLAGNFIVSPVTKSGAIESPKFGPAKNWSSLKWRGISVDAQPRDSVNIEVYGINNAGTQSLLARIRPATDTSLSFIDARVYPYLRLKMQNTDNVFATPNQLKYWRILADYMPEGAVSPNILFRMKDTVEQGDKIDFALAFKNISPVAFDSMKIKLVITDRNNVPHTIQLPKKKALQSGDTLTANYVIDTRNYPGLNTLNVVVNPDGDQPEQYLFNNFIFKTFYVIEDKKNPLLDVTFDGVHIMNNDIVAAKPNVLIKLRDESRFMALSDTNLLQVQIRYPDGSLRRIFFSDTMRFVPASGGANNTASIEYNPHFAEDGDYELLVTGRDVVGNKAGNIEYRVLFKIINKPAISNLLNYPNPFTTSTAFVFTITGQEVPQNIRIQILTITGKIVREITKAELGDLHVGTNITDFKWDGTDMYGQKLANGVYLYRVITNHHGKSLDRYRADGDNTDKYFKAGYGKMYLMR